MSNRPIDAYALHVARSQSIRIEDIEQTRSTVIFDWEQTYRRWREASWCSYYDKPWSDAKQYCGKRDSPELVFIDIQGNALRSVITPASRRAQCNELGLKLIANVSKHKTGLIRHRLPRRGGQIAHEGPCGQFKQLTPAYILISQIRATTLDAVASWQDKKPRVPSTARVINSSHELIPDIHCQTWSACGWPEPNGSGSGKLSTVHITGLISFLQLHPCMTQLPACLFVSFGPMTRRII